MARKGGFSSAEDKGLPKVKISKSSLKKKRFAYFIT
jgi:hypothetical protein